MPSSSGEAFSYWTSVLTNDSLSSVFACTHSRFKKVLFWSSIIAISHRAHTPNTLHVLCWLRYYKIQYFHSLVDEKTHGVERFFIGDK